MLLGHIDAETERSKGFTNFQAPSFHQFIVLACHSRKLKVAMLDSHKLPPFKTLSTGSLMLLPRYGPAEHDPAPDGNTTLITGAENAEQRCRNPLRLIRLPGIFLG